MFNYLSGALVVLITASTAMAGFTNFDDLPPDAMYGPADVITTNDLRFQAVSLGLEPINVKVGNLAIAGGSGLELVLGSFSSGLDFIVPEGTQFISLLYFAGSSTAGFDINGVPTPPATDFGSLDGATAGGVSIAVIPNGFPPRSTRERVILRLSGDIYSLRLHGSELWIDDFQAIPEPCTTMMLLVACLGCLTINRLAPFHRCRSFSRN